MPSAPKTPTKGGPAACAPELPCAVAVTPPSSPGKRGRPAPSAAEVLCEDRKGKRSLFVPSANAAAATTDDENASSAENVVVTPRGGGPATATASLSSRRPLLLSWPYHL